jgi:ABC-type polysaccharide/polyol phosphate transport system ATPase subunit
MSAAVAMEKVSKSYPVYGSPSDRFKELLALGRRSYHRDFWALRDVSFEIERGSTFSILGENGAGKSTLLQLVAGIFRPTSGRLEVSGRVSALLELGSGFNPEFSGRENVFLNGAILGLSNREIERRYPQIVDFAEIGDFINQPVKTYSSGMVVRLAFAVAINVDPEILLVDEALAVGDIYFRQRCMRKIHELHRAGVTILFVTHNIADVKSLATRAMWLANGQIVELGDPERVVSHFQAAMVNKDARYLRQHAPAEAQAAGEVFASRPAELVEKIPNIDFRYGTGRAQVLGIAVMNQRGEEIGLLPPGETIVVRVSVRAQQEMPQPIVGFMLRNHLGVDFSGTNTALEGVEMPLLRPGEALTVDFLVALPELYPGHFSFSPAIANGTLEGYEMCDWIDNAVTLQMEKRREMYGYFRLPCQVELRGVRVVSTA